MRVFISWSGEPSRSIAIALRRWLPLVVQHVQPWMSDEEITSGMRWSDEIALALESTDFGIVCVTASNQREPWLMFEAGALAKRLQTARVVPLCVGIPPSEVTGPLVAFQGRRLDYDGLRKLLREISRVRDEPLADEQVDTLFDALWPQLERSVAEAAKQQPSNEVPPRSAHEMLEELVERIRRLERNASAIGGVASNPEIRSVELYGHLLESLLGGFVAGKAGRILESIKVSGRPPVIYPGDSFGEVFAWLWDHDPTQALIMVANFLAELRNHGPGAADITPPISLGEVLDGLRIALPNEFADRREALDVARRKVPSFYGDADV